MKGISGICLTYARPECLSESVACFMQQDYEGPKELVVLNTFPKQTIVAPYEGVKVVNLEQRPQSLGEARNLAIQAASHDIFLTLDDDDLFLPWHYRNYADIFNADDTLDWVWFTEHFLVHGHRVCNITPASKNDFAFTRKAWEAVGGYCKSLNYGEDQNFVAKVSAAHQGRKVHLPREQISFIYTWNSTTFHVSGYGPDQQGKISGYTRVAQKVAADCRAGKVRTGNITIKPSLRVNYLDQAKAVIAKLNAQRAQKKSIAAIVMLGRYGDIINALPIAKRISETYGNPDFICSKDFASILDGVSYVNPVPLSVPYQKLLSALSYASKYPIVLNAQIYSLEHQKPHLSRETDSFAVDSWLQCGLAHEYHNPAFRPVFDKRNAERERQLIDRLRKTQKPYIVTQLRGGHTAPFKKTTLVWKELNYRWQDKYELIDISEVTAQRVYDLLGLLEGASLIITTDTMSLHLASACEKPVPVIAFTNNALNHWVGTRPRYNCILRVQYDDVKHRLRDVNKAIAGLEFYELTPVRNTPSVTPPKRKLIHSVERHEDPTEKDAKRKLSAQASWDYLYAERGVIPCHYWNYKRTALQLGDHRPLPFLKDALEEALSIAKDRDIVFFTNEDNLLHPDIVEQLEFHCGMYGACTGQRVEFEKEESIPPHGAGPEVWRQQGTSHIGRDILAGTKEWFTQHWHNIPDYILGCHLWDMGMAAYMRRTDYREVDTASLHTIRFPFDMPLGYVGHVKHNNQWSHKRWEGSPANNHNSACYDWQMKYTNWHIRALWTEKQSL